MTISYSQWEEMLNAGIDWKFLIVQSGGMARKSELEEWLMERYGITRETAHDISNTIEYENRRYFMGNTWLTHNANRPAPILEQYGGLSSLTHNGKLGKLIQGKRSLE